MKPAIRILVEHIESGTSRRPIYVDFKDIPAGMTPKRCACWMLNLAIEKLQEQASQPAHAKD